MHTLLPVASRLAISIPHLADLINILIVSLIMLIIVLITASPRIPIDDVLGIPVRKWALIIEGLIWVLFLLWEAGHIIGIW